MTRFVANLIVIFGIAICASLSAAADEKSSENTPRKKTEEQKSLDDQLLDDLSSDLLGGLNDIPSNSLPKKSDSSKEKSDGQNDPGTTPLDQIGNGEDIEFGEGSDPLTRIGQKMRTVESLISQKRTNSKTQRLQKEILDDLAVLIEFQKKQCAKCKGSKQNSKSQSGQLTKGNSAARDPNQPQESTDRLDQDKAKQDAILAKSDFYKEIWGELPERFVQQMQNAGIERFLPKYEKLIEDYYKRLAEERENQP